MDVKGEDVRLWVNEHKKQDGETWYDYSVGVSKKDQDGSYTTTYLKVRFVRAVHIPENLPNGVNMDFEGFLSVDKYTDRNGVEVKKPFIMVTKADFDIMPEPAAERYTDEEVSRFGSTEDDVPF